MKIGLDYIGVLGGGGNGVYSRKLIEALGALDHTNEYYLFSFLHDVLFRRVQVKNKNFHTQGAYMARLGLPLSDRVLERFNNFLLSKRAQRDKLDVIHFTNPLNFTPTGIPTVVTVHDLSVLHNNRWGSASTHTLFSTIVKDILSVSDKIIAVSEYTKKDIVQMFGTDPDKITVVYEGGKDEYYPDVDMSFVKNKFGITSYVLYVGKLQPRKNILNLISAFASISLRFPSVKMVLVGAMGDGEYEQEIQASIKHHAVEKQIIFAGVLDDVELRKLYSGAQCLVYPSFFEGFGLPVLEALQCGIPVITSNTTSLPEVMGDAGLLVNPEDVDDMAHAMERMLSDDTLRAELAAKALAQAKKFSWAKAAEETLAVYNQLLK